MPELRELERKMNSAKALGEVVGAMRNLAAIYVRRAESAVEAIRGYSEIVQTGLIVLLDRLAVGERTALTEGRCVALVFAGDQGLCGTYNNRVVAAALEFGESSPVPVDFISIGRRGYELLSARGKEPVLGAPAATSVEGVKAQLPGLAADIFDKYTELGGTELKFVYNAYEGMGRFKETVKPVLPPVRDMLGEGRAATLGYDPIITASPVELLGAFFEEYFYIELCRALLESHCSENGARLISMTAAGSNIDDRLIELTQTFQSARQDSITSELLDVVGGAEALR